MADFFISYAKQSRGSVEWLAGALVARGYSVWWDTSLVAGQSFRETILRELDNARAVIVIWTPYSVYSDWVIAEAERAHSMSKLIPVVADGIQMHNIPMPFGVLQTVDLTNIGAIEQAASAIGDQIGFNEALSTVLKEMGISRADVSPADVERIKKVLRTRGHKI